MERSIPSQYLLILIVWSQSADALEVICNGTDLSLEGLGQAGTRVGEAEADRVVANALHATGDAALGLEVGQQINLAAHAVVGQTFMACTNLAKHWTPGEIWTVTDGWPNTTPPLSGFGAGTHGF